MLMRGRYQPQIERYRILQVSSCKIRISFPCSFLTDLAPSSLGLPVTRPEKISLSCTRTHEESSICPSGTFAMSSSLHLILGFVCSVSAITCTAVQWMSVHSALCTVRHSPAPHDTHQRHTTLTSVIRHSPASHGSHQRHTTLTSVTRHSPASHDTHQRHTAHTSVTRHSSASHGSHQRHTTLTSVTRLTPASHGSHQRHTHSSTRHSQPSHDTHQRHTAHTSVTRHSPASHGSHQQRRKPQQLRSLGLAVEQVWQPGCKSTPKVSEWRAIYRKTKNAGPKKRPWYLLTCGPFPGSPLLKALKPGPKQFANFSFRSVHFV